MRVVGVGARYAVTMLVVAILATFKDFRLLLVVRAGRAVCPPLADHQIRSRLEREFWQKLAQSTDELNVVELARCCIRQSSRAAGLFPADEVEIEIALDGRDRLVRGTKNGVTVDGSRCATPSRDGALFSVALAGYDGSDPIGELRLRLSTSMTLKEIEQNKLKTFASALYTAIRNATAYAELARIPPRTRTPPRTIRSPACPTAASCTTGPPLCSSPAPPTACWRCC